MLLQTNSLFNLHVFILILQVYIFFYKQSQFLCLVKFFDKIVFSEVVMITSRSFFFSKKYPHWIFFGFFNFLILSKGHSPLLVIITFFFWSRLIITLECPIVPRSHTNSAVVPIIGAEWFSFGLLINICQGLNIIWVLSCIKIICKVQTFIMMNFFFWATFIMMISHLPAWCPETSVPITADTLTASRTSY